ADRPYRGRPVARRRGALRAAGRAERAGGGGRQPQVRRRRAGWTGRVRSRVPGQRGGPARLDGRAHTRRGGGRGAGDAPTPARAVPGPAAAVGTAPSGALQRRGRTGPRRWLEGVDALTRPLARTGRRRVRDRYARGTGAVLRR